MSPSFETMTPGALRLFAELCGWTLARAHARSGDRVAIAAYLGNGDAFDRAITEFATAYADQNDRDFEASTTAAKDGRLVTSTAG
jgi:predicted alpha/beta hydrolase